MKLHDLFESVTFVPCYFDKEHNRYDTPYRKEKGPCQACDGCGKWHGDDPCPYCEGSGEQENTVTDLPEMNVSTVNSATIMDMMGLPREDYVSGILHNKDFPKVLRR